MILLFLHTPQWADAAIDAVYLSGQSSSIQVAQRAQQQFGYSTGYIVSDFEAATLMSPYFEIGLRIRLLARYGGIVSNSFAAVGTATGLASPSSQAAANSDFSFGGYDRPIIRARQLVYGDFKYGRWFLVDLGLGIFNTAGYTSELFRYWSSRVGLHESLRGAFLSPFLELAFTLRSLTQFAQPSNLGLIYPPSVDASLGVAKDIARFFSTTLQLKFEQAVASTQIAGSYNAAAVSPLGAPTYLVLQSALNWKWGEENTLILSYANRTFRWPDNDSSALWQFFEEGFYGQAFSLAWRLQW